MDQEQSSTRRLADDANISYAMNLFLAGKQTLTIRISNEGVTLEGFDSGVVYSLSELTALSQMIVAAHRMVLVNAA